MATAYVVLARLIGDEERYVVIGQTTAPNDVAAIKDVAERMDEDLSAGAVAVPLRNWRLRQAEEKVERKVRWS